MLLTFPAIAPLCTLSFSHPLPRYTLPSLATLRCLLLRSLTVLHCKGPEAVGLVCSG